MSLYCTLPRGQRASCAQSVNSVPVNTSGHWNSTVTSDSYGHQSLPSYNQQSVNCVSYESQSASNFVDNLFDPILREAQLELNGCESDSSSMTIRGTVSELNLSDSSPTISLGSQQSVNPVPKLYYAVDSFDDLKAIRRSSIGLDSQLTTSINSDLNQLSTSTESSSLDSASVTGFTNCAPTINGKPNFYGDFFDSDSAYDSSSDSLKSQLPKSQQSNPANRNTPTPSSQQSTKSSLNRDFAAYQKANQSSSKYFTLPSRLGKRIKKQFAIGLQSTGSSPSEPPQSVNPVESERVAQSKSQLTLQLTQSANPVVKSSGEPNCALNCGNGSQQFSATSHCCCRLGCHAVCSHASVSPDSHVTHCCQDQPTGLDSTGFTNGFDSEADRSPTLETLWEEEVSE